MNRVDARTRSALMSRVRQRNSKPELLVRSLIHNAGYRFRLHRKGLPGTPDIVFPSRSKVVFVHGCFWHGHSCKRGDRIPRTNTDYWQNKIAKNKIRDEAVARTLTTKGWGALTIWECEIKDDKKISLKIFNFLDGPSLSREDSLKFTSS